MKIFLRNFFKRIWSDRKPLTLFMVIVFLYYPVTHLFLNASCPLVYLTGFPCPACGLTRASLKLLSGDFKGAFIANPSIYIILFMLIWMFVARYICGKEGKLTAWIMVAGILGCLIIYIHGMIHYFPNRYPYTYMYDNLFFKLALRH